MLIEQLIEFKLRGLGPPDHKCSYTTAYFHDKRKIFQKNLRLDHYLLIKYYRRQCILLSRTGAKSLTKFNPKMQHCKRVLNLNNRIKQAKGGLNSSTFSIGIQMLKI